MKNILSNISYALSEFGKAFKEGFVYIISVIGIIFYIISLFICVFTFLALCYALIYFLYFWIAIPLIIILVIFGIGFILRK